MQKYAGHRPTSFDSHISLDSREDWLVVPCSRTRDSGCLDESNFHTALALLGGESDNVEVHRFGHWGPGWYEIIIVRPDSLAQKEAEDIEAALADYPVLDDSDFSGRETEAANQVWRDCYRTADRLNYVRERREQFDFCSFSDMLSCVRGNYFAGYASELIDE